MLERRRRNKETGVCTLFGVFVGCIVEHRSNACRTNNAHMSVLREQRHAPRRERLQRHDLLPASPHLLVVDRGPVHDFHLRRARGRRVHQAARDPLQNHARRDQSRQQLVVFAPNLEQRRWVLLRDDGPHDGLQKPLPVHQHHVFSLQPSSVRRCVRLQKQQCAPQVPVGRLRPTRAEKLPARCAAAARASRKGLRFDSCAAECSEPAFETERQTHFGESRRGDTQTQTATANRSDDAAAVLAAENQAAVA